MHVGRGFNRPGATTVETLLTMEGPLIVLSDWPQAGRTAMPRSSLEVTNVRAKVKRFPQSPRCVATHPEPGSASQR